MKPLPTLPDPTMADLAPLEAHILAALWEALPGGWLNEHEALAAVRTGGVAPSSPAVVRYCLDQLVGRGLAQHSRWRKAVRHWQATMGPTEYYARRAAGTLARSPDPLAALQAFPLGMDMVQLGALTVGLARARNRPMNLELTPPDGPPVHVVAVPLQEKERRVVEMLLPDGPITELPGPRAGRFFEPRYVCLTYDRSLEPRGQWGVKSVWLSTRNVHDAPAAYGEPPAVNCYAEDYGDQEQWPYWVRVLMLASRPLE